MAKIDFGGVLEEVVTSEEFPLEKARDVLKDETVGVLGYGVQGPGQALNLRDNGIRVIVGQRRGGASWQRAVDDGFRESDRHPVPGVRRRPGGHMAEDQAVSEGRRRLIFFPWIFHRV